MDLITLEEYKSYTKIRSNEQDDKLNQLIPMVSDLVKIHCGRTFVDYVSTNKVEYFSDGGLFVYTSEQPIITISEVASRSDPTTTEYTVLTEHADYVYDRSRDRIFCLWGGDGFYALPDSLRITYTGGYTNIPEDLKLGVLDLVQFYQKGEAVPRKALNSNQISVEYVKSMDFPPHIKRILDLYRIQ